MSHSHIRGPKPESQPTTSFWILVTAGVGVALLLVLIVAAKIRDGAFDTSHLTAEGKISETRIVVDHTLESMYGGRIYYRIEAHVAFDISGKNQDRRSLGDCFRNHAFARDVGSRASAPSSELSDLLDAGSSR
jgi:hypothetical protein